MIYARSPYIVHIDEANLVRVQFRLYTYSGTKDTDKGDPEYEFDITAVNGVVTFDISPYIREFLKSSFGNASPGSSAASEFCWVTTEIAKDTGSGLGSFAAYEATQLACYGYTDFGDGVNYTDYTINDLEQEAGGIRFSGPITSAAAFPVAVQSGAWDDGLLLHWIAKEKDSSYVLPVFKDDGNNGAIQVRWYDALGGSVGGGTQIGSATITSASIAESDLQMSYVSIPATARSFAVFVGSIDITNGNIHNVSGNCDQVRRVFFQNKFGVMEEIHFVGREIESYSVSSSEYRRSVLSATGTYSQNDGQYRQYNKTGKKRIQLNSGYYPEGYNEQFKQLLLSEEVYLLDAGAAIGTQTAYKRVNIVNSDLQYKYSRYDKVINYTIDFEYAYDAINTAK